MKLKELLIPNYKGFVNFRTTFDEDSPITTIIGQNGVGKSNLIEIIVSIFRAIDLGEQTDFSVTNYAMSVVNVKFMQNLILMMQVKI